MCSIIGSRLPGREDLHASRDGGSKPPYPRKQRVDINTEVLPGEDVPMEDARSLVADPYLIFCVV